MRTQCTLDIYPSRYSPTVYSWWVYTDTTPCSYVHHAMTPATTPAKARQDAATWIVSHGHLALSRVVVHAEPRHDMP